MDKFNWGMRACGVFLLWAGTAVALPAQTFTTLHTFGGVDGCLPAAVPVQATDGNFYGTTEAGGTGIACGGGGCGTAFKITSSGTLTTLHSFDSTDGASPEMKLVQGAQGDFYGITVFGGANVCSGAGCGTAFKITPSGTLTTLYSFCSQSNCTDGNYPDAGLVWGSDGNFYGTAIYGGANSSCNLGLGCGTVFKITPSGTLTTLHSFDGTDGASPHGGLVRATDGDFYGTTIGSYGTVFKITASGTLTTLHSFDGTDGAEPNGLVQATNGDFYGTTDQGGIYALGTVFMVTPSGTLTTLHSFDGGDGANPNAGLVQATNGNFYGTTAYGGIGNGTTFEITPNGILTTLHTFEIADGANPIAPLIQTTNGDFYGTTFDLGTGCGTVFSLSVGLGPFVTTQPTFGKVEATVRILGTNLTGATSVTFNGTSAAFTVESQSEITTTVPVGVTTGTVQVVTPSGTLSSNVPFQVRP